MKAFISAADTARQLNISVSTLTRWRKAGHGPPAYRMGHMWKFDQAEIDTFIQSCRATHRQQPNDAEITREALQ